MDRLLSIFQNHLFTAFLPWIFFSALNGRSVVFASTGALILMIILNLRELKKGFILPWGSVLLFAFFALNAYFSFWLWGDTHDFLLMNSALAVIVLVSLIVGRPFTLQYAREEVEQKYWFNPVFLKTNWILTGIWAILMIVMALPSYFLTQSQINSSWFWNYGLSIICIVIGMKANKTVPSWMKNQQK